MNKKFYYTVTPAQFLAAANRKFTKQGNWLSLEICPFCDGGQHADTNTFAVHWLDGSFGCLRASCAAHGSFFDLFRTFGANPLEYLDRDRMDGKTSNRNKTYSPFVYGKTGATAK